MNKLPQLPLNLCEGNSLGTILPKLRHWPESNHVFDSTSVEAVNAALAAGRPLLLRGEPGSGKSQLARAAAEVLKWPFLSRVVNGRFEPEDLLYRFDAVARLSAAQAGADKNDLKASNFLLPEVLWWALNPKTAASCAKEAARHCGEVAVDYDCEEELGYCFAEEKGAVVLIDEIDKADSEVPNSLLETLSLGGFHVPYGMPYVDAQGVPPLIIITTNEDRELPPAFVRRCLVHQMDLPDEVEELTKVLVPRLKEHLKEHPLDQKVYELAIKLLSEHRIRLGDIDQPKPGQAELLDLLRAVSRQALLGRDPLALVESLHPFVFQKYRKR